jgi:FkbM family methyltransferase
MLSTSPPATLDQVRHRVLVVLDPDRPAESAPAIVTFARLFSASDPVLLVVAVPGEVGADVDADVREFVRILLDDGAAVPPMHVVSLQGTLPIAWDAAFAPRGDAFADARTLADAITAMHRLHGRLHAPAPAPVATGCVAPLATYVGNGRLLVRTRWGAPLLAPADDLSITPSLVLHGGFEQPLERYLLRTLRQGDRVMDLGANFGVHTVLMAHRVGPTGHVLAYEAVPDLAALLRDNLTMNTVMPHCTVVERAAWSGRATLRFTATAKYRGNGSIRPKDADYLARYGADLFTEITVDAESPAEHAMLGPFALVKMDVEGAEPEVLTGMDALIRAGQVRRIVLEYLDWVLGQDAERRLLAILGDYERTLGARFARLDEHGTPVAMSLEAIEAHGALPEVLVEFDLA